jgi:hypothetical protein
MALVLCTGVDEELIRSRKVLLERGGHRVVVAAGPWSLIQACMKHQFDVAVIEQAISQPRKRHLLKLVRRHCPETRVLELYSLSTGRWLENADDWLAVPAAISDELLEHVSALASRAVRGPGLQDELRRQNRIRAGVRTSLH